MGKSRKDRDNFFRDKFSDKKTKANKKPVPKQKYKKPLQENSEEVETDQQD